MINAIPAQVEFENNTAEMSKYMAKRIVKLNGGLGNQMFQYAFAFALSKNFDSKVILDLSWFEDVKTHENVTQRTFELSALDIDYEAATKEELDQVVYPQPQTKIQRKLWEKFKIKKFKPTGNSFVQRVGHFFDKKLLSSLDYFYYDGYFQNEKYFKSARKELLQKFSSSIPLDEKNQLILDKILETNSVSLHIRRGDYVTLESAKNFHGTCPLEYYEKAIKYITKKVKNPHFFLFSDDIEWVVENLKIEHPFTIVDFNQGKGWLDLNLMKNCKHNIVANSSFSWWGAWLNDNSRKVIIAPKRWYVKNVKNCDIIPKEWIRL